MTVFVNGRFLTQPVSGVQRYARELLSALDHLLAQSGGPDIEVLLPYDVATPEWQVLRTRVVRGGRGHLWEQGALAHAARGGRLLSLGNAGPLTHGAHVVCLHDANLFDIPEAFSPRYRAAHRLLRPALARRAQTLLTVSHHAAGRLSHHLGVPRSRFEIVRNSAAHVLRWPVRHGVPERYGLHPDGYLLSVGNQSPNKNLSALTQAHALAGETAPPLAIVGGAAPGVALADAGQGGRVHMLGRVPDEDLRGLYEGARGFVFPSLFEGFGIPPLEAMQLGVPVLCARAGAMPEVLGQAPVWFDPRDVGDIMVSLQAFARLTARDRRSMAVIGRAVAAQYQWADSARVLRDILMRKPLAHVA
ncbi:glycosyltransferase family 4 protein [Tateyamaria sp. SN6-1]|uniref:glycosyltransferase family 4 protein n=1 Tax=Tateyamaria sp. SN6-1 TaxID=3092148 RepID=UPI0039F59128